MQFQQLREEPLPQKPLELARPHLFHVAKAHVVCGEVTDAVTIPVGKAQPTGDLLHHLCPPGVVAVKADAGRLRPGRLKRGGFADVMQQHTPGQRRRRFVQSVDESEHQFHVLPHISLGVELGGLIHTLHGRHLGQQEPQKTRVVEQIETTHGAALGQDQRQFITYAFAADLLDDRCLGHQRAPRGGLDVEIQARGKAHRPQCAQAILSEPCGRIADGPDHTPRQVAASVDGVDEPIPLGIIEHAVDGEIAALCILAPRGGQHVVGVTPVGIGPLLSKASHLVGVSRQQHTKNAEALTHGDGSFEQDGHLFRSGVGGDIPIFRIASQQQITHAASSQNGLMPCLAQTPQDRQGPGVDVLDLELCQGAGHVVAAITDMGYALGRRRKRWLKDL